MENNVDSVNLSKENSNVDMSESQVNNQNQGNCNVNNNEYGYSNCGGYNPNFNSQQNKPQHDTLCIISLVLGIASIVLFFIFCWFGVIVSIPALIISIVAMSKSTTPKKDRPLAVWGLILSILTIVLTVVGIVLVIVGVDILANLFELFFHGLIRLAESSSMQ